MRDSTRHPEALAPLPGRPGRGRVGPLSGADIASLSLSSSSDLSLKSLGELSLESTLDNAE